MEFPAYVPLTVQEHITTLIEGDSWEPHGWAKSLADAENELSKLRETIKALTPRGTTEYLATLREQEIQATEFRDTLANDVECLRRLGHDPRMRDVFSLLIGEFTDGEKLRGFVYAAWAARMNYGKFREQFKKAEELREKIYKTSDALTQLLRDVSNTGFNNWPAEFFSIRDLLEKTDNHEFQNYNLYMWRVMRHHVLGDPPSTYDTLVNEGIENISSPEIEIQVVFPGDGLNTDPVEKARNDLIYAWSVSPDLSELLDTLAKVAKDFRPIGYRMVGAATKSRKQNVKTEYLRAFNYLLNTEHDITLNSTLMRAIAITANVVINSPDIDVSYDDVRKVLAQLS